MNEPTWDEADAPPFYDRVDAGRQLADALRPFAGHRDVIVLGLPRGGVPVAYEVARALDAPLDVLIVRKLGFPGREELAMGAIASGGIRVLNEDLPFTEPELDRVTEHELQELYRRERAYRGQRPLPALENRRVILVDDGLATGATMKAAVAAVRKQRPREVIVAVPVAPAETRAELQTLTDEVICLTTPPLFFGIGQFYQDFSQTSDDVVRDLLQRAWKRMGREPAPESDEEFPHERRSPVRRHTP
jgi:predicted phosphoribosyltransferase